MNRHILRYSLIFLLVLSLFVGFSNKVLFTDTTQYINTAKEFSDLSISKVRNFSSWVYPLSLSFGLDVFPSLFTMQFINFLFLIFDALLLYHITKKRSSFFCCLFFLL